MNLSLLDPFVLAQDCPEALIGRLRMASTSALSYLCYALASLQTWQLISARQTVDIRVVYVLTKEEIFWHLEG